MRPYQWLFDDIPFSHNCITFPLIQLKTPQLFTEFKSDFFSMICHSFKAKRKSLAIFRNTILQIDWINKYSGLPNVNAFRTVKNDFHLVQSSSSRETHWIVFSSDLSFWLKKKLFPKNNYFYPLIFSLSNDFQSIRVSEVLANKWFFSIQTLFDLIFDPTITVYSLIMNH